MGANYGVNQHDREDKPALLQYLAAPESFGG
jgi:hypothetical protein